MTIFVVQRLRRFVHGAPIAFMVFVLLSSLGAYSFVAGFDFGLDAFSGALSLSVEFAWLDSAWPRLLLSLLILFILFAFVLLVQPSSFLRRKQLAGCNGLSLEKGVFLVLLGAAVPCMFGLLALANPLIVGSGSAADLLSGVSDSSASASMFGASSAVSPLSSSAETFVTSPQGFSAQGLAPLVLYAAATCAFTALFEEMLFRGVVIPCVVAKTNQPMFAVWTGALLFAAAHVELAFPFAASASTALLQPSTWISLGQFVLKPIQAALFGFCMGSLYCATRSLRPSVVTHFFFDLLYFAPSLLATGAFPSTYTTGNLFDLVLLSVSVLFLAAAALRLPRSKTRQDGTERDASFGQTPSIVQEDESLENRRIAGKQNGTD